MKMKIILIGYKGFIGSNLHALLNVKGLDVSVYSSTEINDDINNNLNSRVSFSKFLSLFEKSVVINCAGNGNVQNSILNPTPDFDANVRFTQFILETIRISKKKSTYIHLSSAAVYGNPKTLPIMEDSELKPISPYGFHKVLSENLCKQYAELYDIQSIVLRPFSVYGPGLRKQLIWDVHEKFYRLENEETIEFFGTGDETRDFIYIEDLCRRIELLVFKAISCLILRYLMFQTKKRLKQVQSLN